MTVYFENQSGYEFDFSAEEVLERCVSCAAGFTGCPYETEVSVTLVGRDEIHRLNREFRKVDKPTDVLSFPMMNYDSPADFEGDMFRESITVSPDTGELVLGDIVLCADVIRTQAEDYGHTELREFAFLAVHSMLHLFGYDHMEDKERGEMEEAQRIIMSELGIHR